MESSIFPVLYPLYRTYTKISIIFGSAHDLLYKIKHKINFAQNEKEKDTVPRAAQELSPQAGPLTLGPRVRCARSPPFRAVTDGRVPPSDPSSSSRCGSGEPKHTVGELPTSVVGRASFPSFTAASPIDTLFGRSPIR